MYSKIHMSGARRCVRNKSVPRPHQRLFHPEALSANLLKDNCSFLLSTEAANPFLYERFGVVTYEAQVKSSTLHFAPLAQESTDTNISGEDRRTLESFYPRFPLRFLSYQPSKFDLPPASKVHKMLGKSPTTNTDVSNSEAVAPWICCPPLHTINGSAQINSSSESIASRAWRHVAASGLNPDGAG